MKLMKNHWSLMLLASGVFFAGCTKDPKETGGPDETGGEETGGGEETDPEEVNTTIEGTLDYVYTENGLSVCNLSTAFSGSSYSGDCLDCDYAFEITDSTITENAGTTDACAPRPLVILDSETYATYDVPLLLTFWSEFETTGGVFTNVLAASYVYYGEFYGPAATFAYDPSEISTFNQDGNTWTWTQTVSDNLTDRIDYAVTDACELSTWLDTAESSHASGAESIETVVAGSIVNEDPTILQRYGNRDVWTFSANAGELIEISVDTVDLGTWGDLIVFLNTPNECTIAYGDDEADCSFAPASFEYGCPSFSVEAPEEGVYSLSISTYELEEEESREVNYSLVARVNDADAILTFASDDVPTFTLTPYTLDIAGTSTMTEE